MQESLRIAALHALLFGVLSPLIVFAQPSAPSSAEDLPVVEFSLEGGFYEHPVEIHLVAPGAEIYYTTNGNKPDRNSSRYLRSIHLSKTATLRAVAYRGEHRGPTIGHTYLIREPATHLPVVTLALPSWVLFDPEMGLFMQGAKAVDTLLSMPGANFWSRKEVVVNTEIFESDGQCVFRSETGMRLFGGMSRLFPQKSLAIVTRERYGEKRIDHPVFGDQGPKSLKFLVLRNAGSDWGKSHFRDGLMTGLVDGWDLETQAYRPAHVYINGQYWGIYNLREKVNRYFLADHADVDKDSLDLIEHYFSLKRGNRHHYKVLLDYLRTHSLRDPANYAYVQGLMEVENFMDFQIAEIYFDNQDAGGNIKFWRPQTPHGRWRWILYDTDWGFGLHDPYAYRNNSLRFHTEANGPNWPNPPWSTFILRKLLENEEFREAFLNRFADHLNTSFDAARVERRVDEIVATLEPEMPRHLRRWRLSTAKWRQQIGIIRAFAGKRPVYLWPQLGDFFGAGPTRNLALSVSGGGTLELNNHLRIRDGQDFQGRYFAGYPVRIKAVPDYGYRFSHWEGIDAGKDLREFPLALTDDYTFVRAVFEPFTHPLAGKMIINEISINNKAAGDWVEFFNNSPHSVSLAGWVFTDRNHEFTFPDVRIGPNDYLVLCEDSLRFRKVFPEAYNVLGGMNFGISKRRETLQLYAAGNASVDSLSYDIPPADSVFTLNLLLPQLDNSDLTNWEVRWGPGTPNAPNPYYIESSIRQVQTQWLQVGLSASVILLCIMLLILRSRGVF